MQIINNNEAKSFIIPDDNTWIEKKKFKPNKVNELYLYREKCQESYLIIDGEVFIGGKVYGAGTVLVYEPYERRNFFALTEVNCISIKNPEISKDDDLILGELDLDATIAPYVTEKSEKRENGITNEDITVVLQGPVEELYTKLSIESIRRYLPGSKIILSTWKDSVVDGLDVDEIVINEDPGAPVFVKNNGAKHADNRNRLLVSTQGGIKRVKSKYTLKLRSDCILAGDGIVRNFGKYPLKTAEYNIMSKKLVIGELCNITRLKFDECVLDLPFHVSDWFFFGLTEDVKAYFEETEIESLEQMTKWNFKNKMIVSPDDEIGQNWKRRYNAEQYYFISALKRHFDINYWDLSDYSERAEEQSNVAIINNFEILNIREHEIINIKRNNKQPWNLERDQRAVYFTNKKYEDLYMKLFS